MSFRVWFSCALAVFSVNSFAQPYIISTIAGANRLLDANLATTVPLRDPRSISVDTSGGFYLADGFDNRIRYVSALGFISTVAGTGVSGFSGDRGKATAAQFNNVTSIVLDANGNMYVADYNNNRVRKISMDGIVNTIAGTGSFKYNGDGVATNVNFSPLSLALDAKATALYIADDVNYRILKMDLASQKITAIAGTGQLADFNSGDVGAGLNARIGIIPQMVVDPNGNLVFADLTTARVRMVDTNGNVSTVAGSGFFGTIRDGAPATSALMLPDGVAFDTNGALVIADLNRDVILKETSGTVSTVVGNSTEGFSGDGGPPLQASLNTPRALGIGPGNTILFADAGNYRIRKTSGSTISTVAGTDNKDGGPATSAFLSLPLGVAVDGNGHVAIADTGYNELRVFTVGGNINSLGQLNGWSPQAVAYDASGNIYVVDDEPAVLKISPSGSTTQLLGRNNDGGPFTGIAVDSAGNVYLADWDNNLVRKLTPSGANTVIAGNGNIVASGDHGPAITAGMNPFDLAVDSKQNLYIADRLNAVVRKVTPDGTITTVAGNGMSGNSGDGGLATNASLMEPTGVAVDGAGNLYICDRGSGVLRRVTPDGLITTIAGNGTIYPATGDGGLATAAQLEPWRVAADPAGNLYVDDAQNDRIRKLTPKAVTPSAIKVTGGNNQSGNVGTVLKSALTVQVTDSTGAGVPGVVVNFAVSPAGAATLSPASAISLEDGSAGTTVTLGKTAGTITVTASVPGVSGSATFTLTATTAVSPTAPQITQGGVVSAGLSVPAVKALSPNAIATVYGVNFAPTGTAKQVGASDLVNGKLPTNFAGACVLVGGQRAPIYAVYPTQINFQVPALPSVNATVQVVTNCDATGSQTSNPQAVTIQATAPEFFYFLTNADGHNPIAAINASTYAYIGAPGLIAGGSFTPAKPGDVLTLFATGFGATNPSFGPGELPTAAAQVTAPVSVTIGGIAVPATAIPYAGVVGGNAGLYQLNIVIPDSIPDGNQAVVVTIGGVASPPNAYITIQR